MTREVKEKLSRILNSEITKTYFDNITKPLGDLTRRCNVINGVYNVNSFIHNIFLNTDEDDIIVQDYNNRSISELIINGKRINIKSLSYKTKSFFFNNFPFREGDNFNVEYNLRKTIEKLKHVDYFLFIINFYNNEENSIKYDFYLKPTENFNFDTKIFDKTLNGYKGENWIIKSNREFAFTINKDNLGNLIFTYSYNC